jgi:hypothetical protein
VLKARLKAVHAAMLAHAPAQGATTPLGSTENAATDGGATLPHSSLEQESREKLADAQKLVGNVESQEQQHAAAVDGKEESRSPKINADAENVGGNANVTTTARDAAPSETGSLATPPSTHINSDCAHGSPQKLGEFLLALEQSLQNIALRSESECFCQPEWDERGKKWRSFVAAATGLPQHQAITVAGNAYAAKQGQEAQADEAALQEQVLSFLLQCFAHATAFSRSRRVY